MELKKLLVDSKSVWMDFPRFDKFKIKVANISRKELGKIRTACTTQKWDKKVRGLVESLDEERFVDVFAEKTVKDWKGLTLENASSLMLMDIKGQNKEEEVPYSQENAKLLIENSAEFDNWLNDVIFDLDNFRS